MDPFAKTMWRFGWTFAFGMLVAFLAMSTVYFHARPRCSDTVVSFATSPDQQWAATVMERRCGDESPFFTHVNLRPAAQPEKRGYFSGRVDEGEVFLVEQDAQAASVTLQWTSANSLTVRCARCSKSTLRRLDPTQGPLHIIYDIPGVP